MNVYLAGMIGSGKTTLGERLAARLGWSFLAASAHRYREAAGLVYRTDSGRGLDAEVEDLLRLVGERLALAPDRRGG